MHLYPAFLTDSREEFQRELDLVRSDGRLHVIQVDVIDGEFVDNLTLPAGDLAEFDFGGVRIDLHLLTQEPLDAVHEMMDLSTALPVRSIIAQVEHLSHQEDFVQEVRRLGMRAGLSLDFFTPHTAIPHEIWPHLDVIQVMGNEAGFQGKQLHPAAVEKIEHVKAYCQALRVQPELVVDVGVKLENIAALRAAGVDSVSVGSDLWQASDFSQRVSEFLAAIGYNG